MTLLRSIKIKIQSTILINMGEAALTRIADKLPPTRDSVQVVTTHWLLNDYFGDYAG